MREKIEKLFKAGILFEMLSKCQEMVQSEELAGGSKGTVDDCLQISMNLVYAEIEKLKQEIPK